MIGFPKWLSGKESTCDAGDSGSIPGLGRSPGGGNGNLLHYSCLGNPMDRGGWWAAVHGVTKESDTTEQRLYILLHMFSKEVKLYTLNSFLLTSVLLLLSVLFLHTLWTHRSSKLLILSVLGC